MEACSPIPNPNQMFPWKCGSQVQTLLHPLDLCMTKSMRYNLLAYFLVCGCSFIIMTHIYMSNIILLVFNKMEYFIFNTWNFVVNIWHTLLILYIWYRYCTHKDRGWGLFDHQKPIVVGACFCWLLFTFCYFLLLFYYM